MRREELAVVSRAQKAITLSSAECMHLNSDGTTLNAKRLQALLMT